MRRLLAWLWPRSLAGRTALVLIGGLILVQVAGLTIHALDRVDLQRYQHAREISQRSFGAWRSLLPLPPDRRRSVLEDLDMPPGMRITLDDVALAQPGFPPPPPGLIRLLRLDGLHRAPPRLRPREVLIGTHGRPGRLMVSLRFPDQGWLNLRLEIPPPRPWHSMTFLIAFALMTLAAVALTLWAVRRLTRPVTALAQAADRLGRDVNAPPLPAAIGHDLKTPITRLKLRAEFLDDDEQRRKMLADLDEMEAMIAATLAFARDDSTREPSVAVDLASLCRTVMDEAADASPDYAELITYMGPEHLTVAARPGSLKRALANLVSNAVAYGGSATLRLQPPLGGVVRIAVEDDGPGVPEHDLETVFQPFHRLEESRNRETGGTGLGLPIARNIFRAHGGDVVLRNRAGGGLSAMATLPV